MSRSGDRRQTALADLTVKARIYGAAGYQTC